MTKQEHLDKFHDTVGILVKAYLNDTLEHANCYACAVGNLVAAKRGYTFDSNKEWNGGRKKLANWFEGVSMGEVILLRKDHNAFQQYKAIGYTQKQVAIIEYAFESVNFDKDGYKGLMAVVDVLAQIHGVDLSVAQSAKLQFVKC